MIFKYIKTDVGFVIFAPTMKHSDVAKGLGEVESAGECSISPSSTEPGELIGRCFGESISLGLKAHESDSQKLTYQINRYF
jgi:hypothetical protein